MSEVILFIGFWLFVGLVTVVFHFVIRGGVPVQEVLPAESAWDTAMLPTVDEYNAQLAEANTTYESDRFYVSPYLLRPRREYSGVYRNRRVWWQITLKP